MRKHKYSFKTLVPKLAKDLMRVGNENRDGGYVISKRQVDATSVLMGLGVNYDWSFEDHFKRLNDRVDIYCFDFSVGESVYAKSAISSFINIISPNSYTKEVFNGRSPIPVLTKPFQDINTILSFRSFFKPEKRNFFIKKGISDVSSGVFITVAEMFQHVKEFEKLPENSVFVKMDIETSEYDVIEDLYEHRSKINGFAIEFHDIKHFWTDFNELVELLNREYEIIHIHGNNCCGHIPGTDIPNFVEVTFIKKAMLTEEERNSTNNQTYPLDSLDRPNLPSRKDLSISFD